jgi:hypothetical protein
VFHLAAEALATSLAYPGNGMDFAVCTAVTVIGVRAELFPSNFRGLHLQRRFRALAASHFLFVLVGLHVSEAPFFLRAGPDSLFDTIFLIFLQYFVRSKGRELSLQGPDVIAGTTGSSATQSLDFALWLGFRQSHQVLQYR